MDEKLTETTEIHLETLQTEFDELRREVYSADTGILARISKWAGLMGLVISSALASTAIWDWWVTSRDVRLAESIAQLDELLAEIAKANVVVAQFSTHTSQYESIAQYMNGLRVPLADSALAAVRSIDEDDRGAVSAGALLALASELGTQHRYMDAIHIAGRASENAEDKAIELEARRLSAGFLFQTLEDDLVERGRTDFGTVVSEASQVPGLVRFSVSSNAIRDWAIAEAMIGNCEAVPQILRYFDTEFSHPGAKFVATVGRRSTMRVLATQQLCQ